MRRQRVGVAGIYSMDETAMVWDAAAAGSTPRSPFVLSTFRRIGEAPCRDTVAKTVLKSAR